MVRRSSKSEANTLTPPFLPTQSPTLPTPAPKKGNAGSNTRRLGGRGSSSSDGQRLLCLTKVLRNGHPQYSRGDQEPEKRPTPSWLRPLGANTRRSTRDLNVLGARSSFPQEEESARTPSSRASFEERRRIPFRPTGPRLNAPPEPSRRDRA